MNEIEATFALSVSAAKTHTLFILKIKLAIAFEIR